MPAAELARHVIALNVDNIVTVITRPDAFTDAQWHAARGRLSAQGFKIILGPDVAFDAVTSTLMSGKADAGFLRLTAGEHRAFDGRQSVLLLYAAPLEFCRQAFGAH